MVDQLKHIINILAHLFREHFEYRLKRLKLFPLASSGMFLLIPRNHFLNLRIQKLVNLAVLNVSLSKYSVNSRFLLRFALLLCSMKIVSNSKVVRDSHFSYFTFLLRFIFSKHENLTIVDKNKEKWRSPCFFLNYYWSKCCHTILGLQRQLLWESDLNIRGSHVG